MQLCFNSSFRTSTAEQTTNYAGCYSGTFKKKKTFLCLTLSSIRAQSRPSETGPTFVFMCQCVRLRESERDGEQVLVCLIALVGVSR